jgi:signal transduction histidine kinase
VLAGDADAARLEYECSSPDEQRWFEMTVTSFAGDGPRRLVVKHQDVTSRKHTAALERERSALHDAVRAMDQVLSVVGHELRTPLAGLRILSEFLLTDGAASSEQSGAFLKSIHAEVVRMGETVNNLLEAARLDSGRARWNWGEYCPETVVRQAVEGASALADAAGNRVEFESHLDGLSARGDADAVRRLVLNFLSNAIKHTDNGRICVTLRRERDSGGGHDWLCIQIADTGSGIPPHILDRLGEAFALNAGVVGARHIGGTGLGLSICRGIVDAHGGTIEVRSTVGEGTIVTARLRPDLEAPRPLRGTDRISVIGREVAA